MTKKSNLTPYQKAENKAKEEKERQFCINQNICPDCGGVLSIEFWSEFSDFSDYVCHTCPPVVETVETHNLFGFKKTITVKGPAIKGICS